MDKKKNKKKSKFKKIISFFVNLFGKKTRKSLSSVISHLVDEYEKEELISLEEKLMFKNIASFGGKKVFDIMTPRADVIAAEYNFDLDEIKKYRQSWGNFRDRRPELYKKICDF